jgi:hypothetical protein
MQGDLKEIPMKVIPTLLLQDLAKASRCANTLAAQNNLISNGF